MLRRLVAACGLALLLVVGAATPALAVPADFASCVGGDDMPYSEVLTKSVTVQVRTADGSPVAGAAVTGRSSGGPNSGFRVVDATSEVRLDCLSVAGYGAQDGATWSFRASADGYPTTEVRVTLSTSSPDHQTVVARFRAPATVALHVTSGGAPVSDADVSLTEVSTLPPGVLRPAGGNARLDGNGSATVGSLAAGTYEVRVGSARDFSGSAETRTVTLGAGANTASIDFDGARSLTVRFEVDGGPATGIDDLVVGLRSAQGTAWNGSRSDDGFERTATFTAPFLLDGEYTVTTAASGYGVRDFGPFAVSADHAHRGVIVDLATGAVELQPIGATIDAELQLSPRTDVLSEVVATVVSADPAAPPTGTVRFVSGDHEFGVVPLDDGVARLALTTSTPIGDYDIVAEYRGDGAHAATEIESAALYFGVRPDETDGSDGTSFTTTVAAGGVVRFSTDGWDEYQPVVVRLYSEPVYLGEFEADGDGVLSASVTIPAGTEPGAHHLQLRGADWVRTLPIRVTAAPNTSPPSSTSPTSSASPSPNGSPSPSVPPTPSASPTGTPDPTPLPSVSPAPDPSSAPASDAETVGAPVATTATEPDGVADADAPARLASTGAGVIGLGTVAAFSVAVGGLVIGARRSSRGPSAR